MSLDCNSFNANKQEKDTKNRSFLRLLAEGLKIGGDEGNFGREWKRKRLVSVRTRLTPNISREPLIGNSEQYDGAQREAQAKPSTTGAEYRIGFTLAEVLITLSIIGVVAALTIPSLIVKNQEKETIVQLKKAYSVLSNAFNLASIDYGNPSGWATQTSGQAGGLNIMEKFLPYLNTVRVCGVNDKKCWKEGKFLSGLPTAHDGRPALTLADGNSLAFWMTGNGCLTTCGTTEALQSVCGIITVDTNGESKPNAMGKDRFGFWLSQKGIIPVGSPDETGTYALSDCTSKTDGVSCTAWVLLKENMDYPLAGTDWNGQTTSTP